ncbi:ETEC_3214 domain-containing protein [Streptomyces sp. NPDC048269]|uniref:ETEC_3214 domain-containing protein n=1 Tax=Streptomyces sp. NPDC048269 TaxID=3155753 RepID=UPI003445A16A
MSSNDERENTAERFQKFTKRNILLVALLFLSSLVTAVSTLVTATVVVREQVTDWRPAEYRKLRELRAGQTLERFKEKLGNPVYRPKTDESKFVKSIFHPREEYWVEVISDSSQVAMTYMVISCSKDFNPTFTVRRKVDLPVVLNKTSMKDVVPSGEQGGTLRSNITMTGSWTSAVLQVAKAGTASYFREFAWGMNTSCPIHSRPPGQELERAWGGWQGRQAEAEYLNGFPSVEMEKVDKQGLALLSATVVNTFVETALDQKLVTYYPVIPGIDRNNLV